MTGKSLKKTLIVTLLSAFSLAANADQVVLDDQIVDGSTCVGSDCVDGEDFGFDTVLIKQDDPSILFQDTSSSSSFPTNDWRIGTENSSGTSQFYIEDVDAGEKVLTLESGTSGGVALGAGSTIESGAISVGSAGNERRIANVADGTVDTDAANVRQLNQAIQVITNDVSNNYGSQLSNLESELDSYSGLLYKYESQIAKLDDRVNAVGALGAAFSAVTVNPRAAGSSQVSLGVGTYRDTEALAAGLFHFTNNDQVMLNFGVSSSMDGKEVSSRAGATFGW